MSPVVELALHLVGESGEWDVVAAVEDRARVDDLAAALEPVVGHRPRLYRFGEVLVGENELGEVGVRAGDTLGVDLALGVDLRRFGPELRIVCGQGAGRRVRVSNRPMTLGRGDACDVVVADGRVSRTHATVEWLGDEFVVTDLESRNGTVVDGHAIRPGVAHRCSTGTPVVIGDTVFTVSTDTSDTPATRLTGPFHQALTPRRLATRDDEDTPLLVPAHPPEPGARRSMLLLAAPTAGVAALAASGAAAAAVAAFAAVPVSLAGVMAVERWRQRGQGRARARGREQSDAAVGQELGRRRRVFEHAMRERWPDPATLAAGVSRRSAIVWSHDGELRVRLGLGNRPQAVSVVDPAGTGRFDAAATAHLVPRTVALGGEALVIVGPERDLDGVAAWLVLQLLALRPPDQLEVTVATTDPGRWAWVGLAAHSTSVLDASGDNVASALRSGRRSHHLVVFDRVDADYFASASLPANSSIIWRSIEHGWSPPGASLTVSAGAPGRIAVADQHGVADVIPDAVGAEITLQVARSLSGLRTPSSHGPREVPGDVRLLDLVPHAASVDALLAEWREPEQWLAPLLGADGTGAVSVRMAGHNSHMLVAGSTGSGKTRLLESVILSLAAQRPPDRLGIFIVDFKGGNELARLADLPHCAGFVSDRDQSDVERAVRALTREIARRDELMASAGAADADEYERVTGLPMPRLVIVADEFGQFRRDDASGAGVAALLRVAAQGRSKGVHLVLATQSPSTDVTGEIRQNVGVRVCLRVAEASESVAVLGTADAAALPPEPGRALLLFDGVLRELQAPLARASSVAVRPRVAVRTLSDAMAHRPAPIGGNDDLKRVVDSIRTAAQALGVAARPLLAPKLPERIERVAAPDASRRWTLGGLVLGVADRPGSTSATPFSFDPVTHGTMVVIGGPRSGRTGVLLAAAEAARSQPDAMAVHAVDWSDGLASLRGAARDAGVVARSDVEHLRRLVSSLRAPTADDSARLVLIDRLDLLLHECRDLDGGSFPADLVALLNDGPPRRVYTIATAEAAASAAGPVARFGGPRLVLPLEDAASLAAGLPRRGPSPPGRGLLLPEEVEVQVGRPGTPRLAPPEPASLVAPMPARICLTELPTPPPEHLTVGIGGPARLGPVTVDVESAGPVVVVIGRARSGRTTAIRSLAASYRGRRRVVDLGPALATSSLDELLALEPSVFLADDEPGLRRTAAAIGVPELPEQLLAGGHIMIASFEQGYLSALGFSHWLTRRPRPGLLLALDASADRLLACERVGFSPPPELRAGPPGRGWWCNGGPGVSVQVATAD